MANQLQPAEQKKTQHVLETIDRARAGALNISADQGGMTFQNMSEVMEFAKLLAVSGHAVPPHCRGNAGLCLGIVVQAIEWRMSPIAVASKSYVVNDRLSYESQLIHAVIEQRAPIKARLRHKYIGEGAKRQCMVWATHRDEDEPLEYTSSEIGNITPKNSPLWKTKPDLQLFYNASRDWARMYFPDVIMGVYAADEIVDVTASGPLPPSIDHRPASSRVEHLRQQLEAASPPEKSVEDELLPDATQVVEQAQQAPEKEPEKEPEPAKETKPAKTESIHPPALPDYLNEYAKAIHGCQTADEVAHVFEQHVNSNGQLSPEAFEAGEAFRDWKLGQLGTGKKAGGKLFETNPNTGK